MSRTSRPVVTTTVTVTCLVAGLAYVGAVTPLALGAFVLPGVVLVATSTFMATRLAPWAGLLAGGVLALAWAELVNLLSGEGNGPAARSTFAAGAFTAVAVAAALGPAPSVFLVGVVGVLAGALALGAGSEVGPIAIATAVVAVVALASVQRARDRWAERPPGRLAVPLLALLVGGAVASVVISADRATTADPAVLSKGAVDDSIQPPRVLELPTPTPSRTVRSPRPLATPSARVMAPTAEPAQASTPGSQFWLVMALVLLTLFLSMLLRVVWVSLAWRRLRRRLRRGSRTEQVGGAWVWARRRVAASGLDLPVSLSPDTVAVGTGTSALPRTVRPPLVALARATEAAVFAPTDGPTESEVTVAWDAADRVSREAVESLGHRGRAILRVRPISFVPARPTGSSEELVEMRS